MNLEVLLEEAAKNPDKELIFNNDERLGESMACSFNVIKKLIEECENEKFSDDDLIEKLCYDHFDLTPNIKFAERLNFSSKKEHESAVKINKWHDVNFYETLSLYCADNEINLMIYTENDFDGAVRTLETYGQDDKSVDHYYFWID